MNMNSVRKQKQRAHAAFAVQSFFTSLGGGNVRPGMNMNMNMNMNTMNMNTMNAMNNNRQQVGGGGVQADRPVEVVPPGGYGPICDINENDVLCGRGGRINAHSGNVQLRTIVNNTKPEYLSPKTKKRDKAHIAAKIVQQIRTMMPPGRFLKADPNGNPYWFDIGDAKAIKKVAQALREDAPDLREELNEEKEKEKSKDSKEATKDTNKSDGGDNKDEEEEKGEKSSSATSPKGKEKTNDTKNESSSSEKDKKSSSEKEKSSKSISGKKTKAVPAATSPINIPNNNHQFATGAVVGPGGMPAAAASPWMNPNHNPYMHGRPIYPGQHHPQQLYAPAGAGPTMPGMFTMQPMVGGHQPAMFMTPNMNTHPHIVNPLVPVVPQSAPQQQGGQAYNNNVPNNAANSAASYSEKARELMSQDLDHPMYDANNGMPQQQQQPSPSKQSKKSAQHHNHQNPPVHNHQQQQQQQFPPQTIDVFGQNFYPTNKANNHGGGSDISGMSSVREGSAIGSTISSLTAGTAAGIRRKQALAFHQNTAMVMKNNNNAPRSSSKFNPNHNPNPNHTSSQSYVVPGQGQEYQQIQSNHDNNDDVVMDNVNSANQFSSSTIKMQNSDENNYNPLPMDNMSAMNMSVISKTSSSVARQLMRNYNSHKRNHSDPDLSSFMKDDMTLFDGGSINSNIWTANNNNNSELGGFRTSQRSQPQQGDRGERASIFSAAAMSNTTFSQMSADVASISMNSHGSFTSSWMGNFLEVMSAGSQTVDALDLAYSRPQTYNNMQGDAHSQQHHHQNNIM